MFKIILIIYVNLNSFECGSQEHTVCCKMVILTGVKEGRWEVTEQRG